MPHADQLILAGSDAQRDPAVDLFRDDHLRSCAECRELRRKVGHADRLIAAPERSLPVPSWSAVAVPRPVLGRAAIATIAVVVLVVGLLAGGALRTFRERDDGSPVAAPGGPLAPTLPKDWQLVTVHDLLIPLPPGWTKTIDAPGQPPSPDGPRILYFRSPALREGAAGELTIWIWPSPSLDHLVEDRYVKYSLSLVSQGTVASWRPVREVIGVAQWRDARGAGSYLSRSLFVQADPERVVMVGVFGPQTPSKQTEPTAEMRAIQELVISHVVTLRDVNKGFAPEQARAAIDPIVPLSAQPVGRGPASAYERMEWTVKGRTDTSVRVVPYSDAVVRHGRGIQDAISPSGSFPVAATARGIGNLVVWAISPDANVRYSILTALDGLLEGHAVPMIPGAECPRTRITDASGVITTNGTIGIVGDTSVGSTAFNDSFTMVKRGAVLGDRVGVDFVQIGPIRSPASSVSYGVPASPRKTAWGDVVFQLGVKPIGFPNGCWRLFVDGADSGIVLFVGP